MVNSLLCNVLMVVSLWFFGGQMMSRKYHNVLHEMLLLGLFCLSSFCGILWLRIILVLVGCIGYVCSKYIGTIDIKVFVVCVYVLCLMMSECLCASLFHVFSHMVVSDAHTGLYTMLIVLVFLLLFVFLYSICQLLKTCKKKYLRKNVAVVCILPISCLLLLLNIEDVFTVFVHDGLFVVGMIGIFLSNGVLFYLYCCVVQGYELKEEYSALESKYHGLSTLYASSSSLLHEVSRKVFALRNESVVMNDMYQTLFQQFYVTHTSCMALRKVLIKYSDALIKNEIAVDSDMRLCEFFDDKEALFEDLLVCAMQSCSKVNSHRSILFSSYEFSKYVVCRCAFSCVSEDTIENLDRLSVYSKRVNKELVDGFYEITLFLERGSV